jgi:hypothetical protein
MKKILTMLALTMVTLVAQAAQVDVGFTTGKVTSSSVTLPNASFEVGIFTGYTDTAGLGWFSGKNYDALRASWTSFAETSSPSVIKTDSVGQFYGSYDLGSTALNTRIFAWVQDAATPSSSSTAWAVISGTIGASDIYSPMWLAPSSTATDVNVIEAGQTVTTLFAGVNAAIVPSTAFDTTGANLNFELAAIPEPSVASLLAFGTVGLVALRVRRKS